MNDPTRDWSTEARELVEAGRLDGGLGDERRKRNRNRLLASVGASVAISSAASAAAAGAAQSTAMSVIVKVVLGLAVVSAAGVGTYAWTHRESTTSRPAIASASE